MAGATDYLVLLVLLVLCWCYRLVLCWCYRLVLRWCSRGCDLNVDDISLVFVFVSAVRVSCSCLPGAESV